MKIKYEKTNSTIVQLTKHYIIYYKNILLNFKYIKMIQAYMLLDINERLNMYIYKSWGLKMKNKYEKLHLVVPKNYDVNDIDYFHLIYSCNLEGC